MCGIAGAFGIKDASNVVVQMLKALQHRGQESAGIVSSDGERLYDVRGLGLADEVFAHVDFVQQLPGTAALGHLRYSTSGDSDSVDSIQPFKAEFIDTQMALAHNGNLTNAGPLRTWLKNKGSIFRSGSDTEVFMHLCARTWTTDVSRQLRLAVAEVEGAYSLLVLLPQAMCAVMDPHGFRPLVMARVGESGHLFASETCAFDVLHDLFPDIREVTPLTDGQIIMVEADGVHRVAFDDQPIKRHCSFEPVYFSRPDSLVFGLSVHKVREALGRALARKTQIKTDIVTAVPDSSNSMALAYAQESGMPYALAIIRNHYTGRTFISPRQVARELGVRVKLNAVRDIVDGCTVTVVDDSLVRGTTGRKVAKLLREAGATEVHMRIASPPVIHPCYWGIDTPNLEELAAATTSMEELRVRMGVDSLEYLTVEELRTALGDREGRKYCTTCFTGQKPVEQHLLPTEHLLRKRASW